MFIAKPFNIPGLLFLYCIYDLLLNISFSNCLLFAYVFYYNSQSSHQLLNIFHMFIYIICSFSLSYLAYSICAYCPCAQSLVVILESSFTIILEIPFTVLCWISCFLYPCFLLDLLFHFWWSSFSGNFLREGPWEVKF